VSIVWNLKIVTTALALRCFLGRHLHWMQWLAIVGLTCGVVISQEDKLAEGWAHSAAPALLPVAGSSSTHPNRKLVGLLFCMASIASVTVANVTCEYLYKRPPKAAVSPLGSMYSRNCSLYFFGVACNLTALCVRSPGFQLADTLAHLFDGYNGFVAGPPPRNHL
jgi:drug/metabolite transporter (DMT)-like permease